MALNKLDYYCNYNNNYYYYKMIRAPHWSKDTLFNTVPSVYIDYESYCLPSCNKCDAQPFIATRLVAF